MAGSWRPLNGVLLLDKSLELSSNTALQRARRLFRAEKAGHTGTLDPLATGLLPVCFGEATKFSGSLLDADKTYQAKLCLGKTTTTGDGEGEIIATSEALPTVLQVHEVLAKFRGEIKQLPPMHSALKFQGKPLYEYIRKGETVEREARNVIIHELEMNQFSKDMLDITVRCSKGTYIRTLAEDIGNALGCGAYLIGLRRTGIGPFVIENAYTLAQLESVPEAGRDRLLLPADCMLLDRPVIELDGIQVGRLAQGQRLGMEHQLQDGLVRLYSNGEFVGLGELEGRRLSPRRMISSVAQSVAQPKTE